MRAGLPGSFFYRVLPISRQLLTLAPGSAVVRLSYLDNPRHHLGPDRSSPGILEQPRAVLRNGRRGF